MTTTLKDKWVKALRSGEYRQGFGVLHAVQRTHWWQHNYETFCPLGVLAEVAIADGVPMKRRMVKGARNRDYITYDGYSASVPSFAYPELEFVYNQGDITWKNDRERKTFDEIADWIEKNL